MQIKNLGAEITFLIDTDLRPEQQAVLKEKLEQQQETLKNDETTLKQKLDSSQKLSATQLRPYYVLTAIFSLFVLFLGGQEQTHQCFPIHELFTVNLYMILTSLVFITLLLFSKYEISVLNAVIMLLIWIVITIFMSQFFYNTFMPFNIKEKYYVDMALILSYLPFFIASIVLFIPSIILSAQYRWKFYRSKKALKKMKSTLEDFQKLNLSLNRTDSKIEL